MKKRILSLLLCLALCLSVLPTAVFAGGLPSLQNVSISETGILRWDALPGTAFYRITIGTIGEGAVGDAAHGESYNLQNTCYQMGFDTGTYKVYLDACNSAGGNISETWSGEYYYNATYEKLAAPTNLHFEDDVAKWSRVPHATQYNVMLLNENDQYVDHAFNVTETEYRFALTPGEKYKLNVTAKAYGYISSEARSDVYIYSPSLIPWGGVGLLPNGIMRWRPIEGASSYYVTVDGLGFTVTKTHYNVKALCEEKDFAVGKHTVTLTARDENGKTISETWTGEFNFEHTPEILPYKAPTCTESGLTEGQKCSACGRVLMAQQTIPAKGHSYQNGKCTVCGAADPNMKTVNHRLYNPYTLEHMFCSDETERQNLLSIGWTYDGIAFMTPASGKPVYRLYNPAGDWHTYSADTNEIAMLQSQGWSVDGVMCFSADSNGRPVYRMYNPYESVNYLLFTSGTEERDWLVTLGWVYQGIAWYVEK